MMFLKKPKAVDITSAAKQTTLKAKRAWSQLRRATLYIGGLGCFCVAAFSFSFWAGMVTSGVCLFVLEMLTGDE